MPNEASQPLFIVGASVRAAAQSAVRAGFQVWCADLFADADLCEIATARSVSRYPAELLAALAAAPQAPWIYTGALENYPALLSRMAKVRECWGNSADMVRRVRDPLLLASTLPPQGVPFPATLHAKDKTQLDKNRWLIKPKRTGGGSKVTWLDKASSLQTAKRAFIQEFVPGQSYSAVYLGAQGRATLLGMTRQLLGVSWLRAQGFSYCGSIGPSELSEMDRAELQHIGNVLADQFGLVGLFGVDVVRRSSERNTALGEEWVVIEVNPRYTASIEVLERTLHFHSIAWHRRACTEGLLPSALELPKPSSQRTLAKGILFAHQDCSFHNKVEQFVRERNVEPLSPVIADIPHANARIAEGSPIVTLFAAGNSEDEAENELRREVSELEELLYQG